ncbi:MAG: DinB family protein [Planctomycetales bacterium]|nr:DinB family protein [Planctomycetales bacterium]
MTIGQSMLPEFDHEMATTRRVLERVPEDKLDWKAHEKSNTIGWLANHLVEIPSWTGMTINIDELDIDPPGGKPYETPKLSSVQEMLAAFDKHVTEARAVLENVDDAKLFTDWTMLKGGEKIFSMPKLGCIRTWVLNHMIHHRAIMAVYLRLNDIPVPSIYGPSGDETGM